MLPPVIPIFPLPNVVLFPNVFLPLHIFEPRYRAMVADALEEDRIIGMVLLRPGWERDYEGRPPIYPVGCAGLVTHAERQPGGEFNIVLRGLEKFRVRAEDASRPYRRAEVEPLHEPFTEADRAAVRAERDRLDALVAAIARRTDARLPDEDLVNALAQYLELEPVEKQALLERDGVRARCHSLIELLEMKTIASRSGWAH